MSFLNKLKNETTIGRTENNAVTYTSTLNKNLDFFAQAGAIRSRKEDAGSLFRMAYSEDKEMALRNLSYLRDVRCGLGERDAFREMMHELIDQDDVIASKFLIFFPELGRWDDIVDAYYYAKTTGNDLVASSALYLIRKTLSEDLDNAKNGKDVTLLAKWLPSPSVSNKTRKKQANMIAHDLGIKVSKYRKLLSSLRKYIGIVETKLTERDYANIDFEKLPSRALFKYRSAFKRNMEDEYNDFIVKVTSGEVKMNASNVLPYEIIRSYINEFKVGEYNPSLEATWKSLDDTIGELEENAIVVADTSSSMFGNPWFVAESLAIYCAERLSGAFKNHFITFSSRPKLIELPDGGTLKSKIEEYHKHSIVSNTDLQATFDLILDTAVKNNTPQDELPSKIIIVSDQEFDEATKPNFWLDWQENGTPPTTNFEFAKKKFESKGYKLPNIVFWNVDSRNDNLPVRHNDFGVALVSGLTPHIFKSVLKGDLDNPEIVMKNTLLDERYDFVKEILN